MNRWTIEGCPSSVRNLAGCDMGWKLNCVGLLNKTYVVRKAWYVPWCQIPGVLVLMHSRTCQGGLQGSRSVCGRLEIPQVEKGEHRRSFVHECARLTCVVPLPQQLLLCGCCTARMLSKFGGCVCVGNVPSLCSGWRAHIIRPHAHTGKHRVRCKTNTL